MTERDSAPVQYNGILQHSRYWYTKVLWLTIFDQSEPVAHPYLKAGQEVNRLDQLNFAEFVDVLCKMAILAFDRPELTKQYPDDDSR